MVYIKINGFHSDLSPVPEDYFFGYMQIFQNPKSKPLVMPRDTETVSSLCFSRGNWLGEFK